MTSQKRKFIDFLLYDAKLDSSRLAQIKYCVDVFFSFFADKNFTRENFTDFIRYLIDEKKWKQSSANQFIALGKNYAKFIQKSSILDGFRYYKIPNPVIEPLTYPEVLTLSKPYPYRFRRKYLNQLYKTLYLFLYTTGARIEEALNLKRSDIIMEGSIPCVVFRDTKTSESRVVPIPNSLYKELTTIQDKTLLFESYRGHKLAGSGINHDLKLRAKYFGIKKHIYNHLFRHSCITNLISQGVPIAFVATLVGHKDIGTTYKHYFHSQIETLRSFLSSFEPYRNENSFNVIIESIKSLADRIIDKRRHILTIHETSKEVVVSIKKAFS